MTITDVEDEKENGSSSVGLPEQLWFHCLIHEASTSRYDQTNFPSSRLIHLLLTILIELSLHDVNTVCHDPKRDREREFPQG